MPELPEVETIARNLRTGNGDLPALPGLRVRQVELLLERSLATPSPQEFRGRLTGQTVEQIWRRGKFLVLTLSRDHLLIHLRMSGDLLVERVEDPIAPHHRMMIEFDVPYRLSFNDPRKFGRVWLVDDPQVVFRSLGPEPLGEEFTAQSLYRSLKERRRQLKPLLLDQSFIAGLGNIYADEALFRAGLHPLLPSDQVSEPQALRLWESIRLVLEEGILRNGASIDWVYRGGDFQNYFRVYQRTGDPCSVCATPVIRMVVGQRGTHYCPQCQPLAQQ
jgi:formamidopyrimidine-DNA glycosylase